jgi:hypothetical protein
VTAQRREERVRDRTDADLDRRAVGDALGDECCDAPIDVARLGRVDLDQRPIDLGPAEELAAMQLLRPNVRGICSLTSRKNGTFPMNAPT